MKPTTFPEANTVFAKDQPEYQPIPAFINQSDKGEVVSCWKLNWRERLAVLLFGRVYVMLLTFNKPLSPQSVYTSRREIFIKPPVKNSGKWYHLTARQFVWLTVTFVSLATLCFIVWLTTVIA